ncbi:MAG: CpaE family protein [Actinomycetota bacterium]
MRVVTVAGEPEQEAAIAARLGSRGDLELVLRCVDRIELLAAIRGGALDGIVSVGIASWFDAQCAHEAARAGIRVVGMVDDALEIERMSALGAELLPVGADVDEVIDRCREAREPAARLLSSQPSTPRGKLIAVWGPKGAPGRTTVAIELAAELCQTEPETLLIDGDPYGGDMLQLLGIIEELPTIVWATRMAAKEELDAARLMLDLRRAGKRGPVFLPGLPRADLWAEVSDFGWRQLLQVVRATFRFTVCEVGFCLEPERAAFSQTGEGRNMIARTTIAEAEQIVAVCRGDLVGTKNFLWAFEELRALVDVDDILIVANRVGRSEQREVGELIRRHAGKRPIAYVPDRPAEVSRAVRSGVPVRISDSSSDVSSAMRALVAAAGGRVPARGVLTRLAGRGG